MPIRPFGPPNYQDKDLQVADLIDPSGNWDQHLVTKLLPAYSSSVLCLRPSIKGAQDEWIWLPNRSGIYSTKSGYHIASAEPPSMLQQLSVSPTFNWSTEIWNTNISTKLQFFLWKLAHNALPTGENLLNRGLLDNSTCPHCGELETLEHLFFHCPFAVQVWSQAPLSTPVISTLLPTFKAALFASKTWICLPPSGLFSTPIFPWLCWAIWTARNFCIFEERSFTIQDTITKGFSLAREWSNAQFELKPILGDNTCAAITSPPLDVVLCNTDAAWNSGSKNAGLGWSFSDQHHQQFLEGSMAEQFVISPLMAEALAIRAALNHAKMAGLDKISILSDAQDLIRAISSRENIKEIFGLLFDIQSLASSFTFLSFSFIPRSENVVADSLAKKSLVESSYSAAPM